MSAPPPFARAVACGVYEDPLRRLIHLLKYDALRPAADHLGRALAERVALLLDDEHLRDAELLVCGVPLHPTRERERGFNQSTLILRPLLEALRRKGFAHLCESRLLARRRATQAQVGSSRAERLEHLRGAFVARDKKLLRGRPVLLVDDVMTTGATFHECASVLLNAGASNVYVAAVARALTPAPLAAFPLQAREGHPPQAES